jgi:hypothetical protein
MVLPAEPKFTSLDVHKPLLHQKVCPITGNCLSLTNRSHSRTEKKSIAENTIRKTGEAENRITAEDELAWKDYLYQNVRSIG